jgi:hypothetical protein
MKTKGPRTLKNEQSMFASLVRQAPLGLTRNLLENLGFKDNLTHAIRRGDVELFQDMTDQEIVIARTPGGREHHAILIKEFYSELRRADTNKLIDVAKASATVLQSNELDRAIGYAIQKQIERNTKP